MTATNALRMPPASSGKELKPEQIALLKRWIREGGKFAPHWAYAPLRKPVPPAPRTRNWALGPVDRFILARLEKEGLKPSPDADRATLLRRLSLDLTGLPPTPRELDAFLADRSPQAYGKVVDRLLASPRYGERMAQYWLDLVRYADTVGYHGDQDFIVWPYRDYVIRAFNENKRFDQFTREQLAGDLLPDAGVEQKVASGYNRLGMMSAEGGVQDKEYRAKYAAERVRNTSVVWMAQTMGCAECHDHKFDPISTRDFYSFEAIFADLKEKGFYDGGYSRGDWGPFIRIPTPEQQKQLDNLNFEVNAAQQALAKVPDSTLARGRAEWEGRVLSRLGWKPAVPVAASAEHGSEVTVTPDGLVKVDGPLPAYEVYTVTIPAGLPRITGIRLEALPDAQLPGNGISRAGYYFVLSDFEAEVRRGGAAPQPVKLSLALVNGQDEGYPGMAAIDGRRETGWAIVHGGGGLRTAVFQLAEPLAGGPETRLTLRIRHEAVPRLQMGRFRISLTGADAPDLSPQAVPDDVLAALRKPAASRTPAEEARITAHYRKVAPELAVARARLARFEAERSVLLGRIPKSLVSEATEPRPIRILPRGNWQDESGPIVEPAVPETLGKVSKEGRLTRKDLADWLVSPENPLTARVFVNRLWKLFYGVGLAKNVDDFGVQGEPPVHPELLDWLAGEFIRSGWDVKHMVRLMVTTRTYRQSSVLRPDLAAKDPFNRLYARQSAFRLDAEFIRDVALAAGGLLSDRIGGPSVRPYGPSGYLAALNFPKREWATGAGEDLYRRGLYIHWQRTFLHPSLLAFDAPTREECTAQRVVSNTPMQALVLLNDPAFVEAGRAFAARILKEGGPTFETRAAFAFRTALTRSPSKAEVAILKKLFAQQRARYAGDRAAAEALLSTGDRPRAQELDVVEHAAWTQVARAVLNLHEAITRN